jgi:YHS domain-containing protein/peroxiredoxin
MRQTLAIGIALTMAAGTALAQCPGCPMSGTTSDSGRTAGLRLASVNGDTFDLGTLKQPLVVLVAGTDSTSRLAAEAVQQSFAAAAEPVMFFGVINAGTKQAKTAAQDWNLGYTVLSDPEGKAMVWLEAEAVPLVALLNRAGKVIGIETEVSEANVAKAVRTLAQTEAKFVDPVCGMMVTAESAAATYEYQGKTYHFCSKACKENFARNPQKYLAQ